MAPVIRAATSEECTEIRALIFAVLDEYGLEPAPQTTDKDLDDIVGYYQDGCFDVLVGDDGDLIGTVGLKPVAPGVLELRKMYIKQRFRGRGFGKRLLKHSIARARELGAFRVELETASVLREALGLYEAFGFQPIERRDLEARCDQVLSLTL